MEYDINIFKNNMSDYLTGKLPKEELGEWAMKAYYDLLTGGYIELNKIVLYHLLKKVSTIHICEDDIKDEYPCTEKDILNIYNILDGNEDRYYSIKIGMPSKRLDRLKNVRYFDVDKQNLYQNFYNELVKYEKFDCVDNTIINYFDNISHIQCKNITIFDLLEQTIVEMIKSSLICNAESIELQDTRIYAIDSKSNNRYEMILRYLECYIGIRDLYVFSSLIKGKTKIFLQV